MIKLICLVSQGKWDFIAVPVYRANDVRDYRRCVVRASGCRGETVIARTSGRDVWTDSVEVPAHKACNPGKYSGNGARPRAYPGPYTLLYFNINKN